MVGCPCRAWTIVQCREDQTQPRVVPPRDRVRDGVVLGAGRLRARLRAPEGRTMLVTHRAFLGRFGTAYLQAARSATGRTVSVVHDETERLDQVQSFVDAVLSLCA